MGIFSSNSEIHSESALYPSVPLPFVSCWDHFSITARFKDQAILKDNHQETTYFGYADRITPGDPK